MNDRIVPIDPAGRIVLPKDVREELAIKPGDTLKVSIQGSSVTLTPNKEEYGLIRKGKALVFSSPGEETLNHETLERILEEERADREDSARRDISGRKRRA
ncbi:MAG TPA: AbrB/MazE/SpoVT family DNA-binding domain-containing protein [Verrucomicrobiae bacterium]|nr:AbrB/MazE/SpoVT family DNA-binding domain-containing protein [Verrucomicrobiae bacterium]